MRRVNWLMWQRGIQRTDAERLAKASSGTVVPFSTEGQRSHCSQFTKTLAMSLNSHTVELD